MIKRWWYETNALMHEEDFFDDMVAFCAGLGYNCKPNYKRGVRNERLCNWPERKRFCRHSFLYTWGCFRFRIDSTYLIQPCYFKEKFSKYD